MEHICRIHTYTKIGPWIPNYTMEKNKHWQDEIFEGFLVSYSGPTMPDLLQWQWKVGLSPSLDKKYPGDSPKYSYELILIFFQLGKIGSTSNTSHTQIAA